MTPRGEELQGRPMRAFWGVVLTVMAAGAALAAALLLISPGYLLLH